jgi:sugar phosphate isomerase/epimerase
MIGTFTRPWHKFELDKGLAAIRESGFRTIGMMRHMGPDGKMAPTVSGDLTADRIAELKGLLEKHDLVSVVHWGLVDMWNDDGVEKFRREIDVAHEFGERYILTGGASLELGDTYLSIMKAVVDYAAGKDVTIAVKPHGGIVSTAADCLRVVEDIGHESFRVFFDPANITFYTGGAPLEGLDALAPYVCGLCLKDCRGGEKGEINIPPGEGEVDWERLFGILREHGFNGPSLIELLGGEDLADINERAVRTRERFEAM